MHLSIHFINIFGNCCRIIIFYIYACSHPIEVPVGHPSEIDEIFDLISYSKGASVIRMLHNWIGDKVCCTSDLYCIGVAHSYLDCQDFKKGMNIYLNKFKYKNAATGQVVYLIQSTPFFWLCVHVLLGQTEKILRFG